MHKKILFLWCIALMKFFVASEFREPFFEPHSYSVPDIFKNGKVFYKVSQRLRNENVLRVEYLKKSGSKKFSCTRIFYPNGEMQETYRGDDGLFPSSTMVIHRLDGNKRIMNFKENINIVVSAQDVELAKQILNNTAKNNSGYWSYPWRALFAEV